MLNSGHIQDPAYFQGVSRKSKIQNAIIGIFLWLFQISFVPFAFAENDITLSLGAGEEYSDNFYRSETDEIAVFTTIIRPCINARAWTDQSSVFFAYSPIFNFYSGHYYTKDKDSRKVDTSDDNYIGHNLNFTGETTFFERLKLTLEERYRKTREPGAYDEYLKGASDREMYSINQVKPFLTYDFAEKFRAILGYQNEVYNYEVSEDSHEDRGYFTLRYHLDDRTSIEVEEQYWWRRYPHTPDYNSSQTMLIFRRELSDYLGCEIGAGYLDRRFRSVEPQSQYYVEDWNGFVYRLALTGESDVSRLFLSFRRNLNDFSKGTTYFDAHRLTVHAEHTFLEKMRCKLGGYYQENDYFTTLTYKGSSELRKDKIWDAYFGIKYWIADWVSAGLSYEYTDRDSNSDGESYTENRVFGNIEFEYSTAKRQ